MNSTKACAVKLEVLRPGDWIEMRYGHERMVFYVLRNDPVNEVVWLNRATWLASSAKSTEYSEIRGDQLAFLRQYDLADRFEPRAIYLGRTKKRWWLPLAKLVLAGDLVCPFVPFKLA